MPKTQPQNLLTEEELEELYESYWPEPHRNNYHHTDKHILGPIIYQALDMGEFMKIELHDLQFEKGLLYVRSGRQKQRYVPLKANQVLGLDRYIREVRPQLASPESDKLFAPQADDYSLLHWQFKQLSVKVKTHAKDYLDIQIHKLGQLRQSRVAIWVKEEGLRKAQYLAGFRKVSSAERKRKASLEDLKKQVNIYHLLQ